MNTIDRKFGGVCRRADIHIAAIAGQIINPIGNGNAAGQGSKVIDLDGRRPQTPDPARIPKGTDQFALLAIHTDDRPAVLQKCLNLCLNLLNLIVPLRTGAAIQHFVVDMQRILLLLQQATYGVRADRVLLGQRTAQLPQALAFPFVFALRIACRLMLHQIRQSVQDLRIFFSTRGRPAPAARICCVG